MSDVDKFCARCTELVHLTERAHLADNGSYFRVNREVLGIVLDAFLASADRRGYERGCRHTREKYQAELKSLERASYLVRECAGWYDKQGQVSEGNVLRDAADLLEQSGLKSKLEE